MTFYDFSGDESGNIKYFNKLGKKLHCSFCGSEIKVGKDKFSHNLDMVFYYPEGYVIVCVNCRDEYFRRF